jgi:cobalt-zinc-cadmium efflux system outer membrane protein
MKQRRLTFLLILAILSTVSLSLASDASQPPDANNLTRLEDYLRYAALNNAALKASFETWKAAVEAVPQAKALPDPKFTYGYFIREVETRVGPQRQKFDLMQTFPWFGTIRARTDQAAANANAAQKRYEAKKLELFQQVKHAFYEYGYLAKAIQIANESLDLIKHFEQVARTKYAGATSSHPDVIRAQIELAILEDRLKSLKELRPAITAELNGILNRPADANLPWPEPLQYQQTSIDFAKLYALIVQNNPDLKAVDYEIEAMRNAETLAKKRSLPNIGVGVSYIDTAHAMASGVRDSGKDPVIAMISLNLPIWTESYKAAERQAKAMLLGTRQEKIQLENTLGAEARRLLYEFDDTARKIRLYRDIVIPKTKEMVLASESAYEAATIDFLSLIDAQDKLLNYELLYERAAAENAQNLAKLERIAGTSLPTTNVDTGSEKENNGVAK